MQARGSTATREAFRTGCSLHALRPRHSSSPTPTSACCLPHLRPKELVSRYFNDCYEAFARQLCSTPQRLRRDVDVMVLTGRAGGSVPPEGTPLPLSADMEQSRPEIGGSFGGFIAVVVALASIFLISCIGIFILLRDHEPTPYERNLRRTRARGHDFSSEAPIGPPGIRERLARLFGRRPGWIKASAGEGGDEWDASDDHIPNAFDSVRERDRTRGEYPASFATAGRPRPPESMTHSLSADSVEVELNAPSAVYGVSPRSPGPSLLPDSELEDDRAPSVHIRAAPVSVAVSQSPPSSLSTPESEPELDAATHDERRFAVPSGSSAFRGGSVRSMRKFDNGTKFKESL